MTEDETVGWHHNSIDISLCKIQEMVRDREAWHATVHGVAKGQIRLSDWTTTNRSRGKSDVTVVAKLEQWSVRHDVVYIVQRAGKAGND